MTCQNHKAEGFMLVNYVLIDRVFKARRAEAVGARLGRLLLGVEDCKDAARRVEDKNVRIMHLFNAEQLKKSAMELAHY